MPTSPSRQTPEYTDRAEFFARAPRQYLDQLADASLTQQIDAAIDAAGTNDSGHAAAAAGRAFLVTINDE